MRENKTYLRRGGSGAAATERNRAVATESTGMNFFGECNRAKANVVHHHALALYTHQSQGADRPMG